MTNNEKIRDNYNGCDTGTVTAMGGGVGVVTGAVLGAIAGVAIPSVVGWEIGNYVQHALEFGAVASVATKLSGAAIVTAAIGYITIPIGIVGGGAAGGIAGSAAGAGIGLAKEGLERLLKRETDKDQGE
ncbi:MAG: hypothetical protein HY363_00420 [Candidatus Aenigmarchaeota archaeon]|nr:hypothetical protein [Candidatus Aenigmarchaeota archaeon]